MRKELPILYSTPMVKAKLAGVKTQTRRVIKPQPDDDGLHNHTLYPMALDSDLEGWRGSTDDRESIEFKCPYGQPGDLLWVRESWQLVGWNFEDGLMDIRYADGTILTCEVHDPTEDSMWLLNQIEQLEKKGIIKQDNKNEENFVFTDKKQPFKPSIHMPKAAARIWDEVVSISVKRLQEISEASAIAEGVETLDLYPGYDVSAKGKFEGLWGSINGYNSWEANPWVWVIKTKTLSTTGRPD